MGGSFESWPFSHFAETFCPLQLLRTSQHSFSEIAMVSSGTSPKSSTPATSYICITRPRMRRLSSSASKLAFLSTADPRQCRP